jgi:hypothetical protein
MSYSGKVLVYAPDGHQVGQFGNMMALPSVLDPNGATNQPPQVSVSTYGQHFLVSGLGPHVLKDVAGNNLGTITIEPWSTTEAQQMVVQAEKDRSMPTDFKAAAIWAKNKDIASGMSSGSESSAYVAFGFDKAADFYYYFRGDATVSLKSSDGNGSSADTTNRHPGLKEQAFGFNPDPSQMTTPTVAIIIGDKTHVETGYGKREYTGADGKTKVTLDIEPPPTMNMQVPASTTGAN